MRGVWDRLLETLLWVRVGQELGSDSDLAQTIAGGIDAAIRIIGQVVG
jgi:hypothetical protein